MYTTIVPGLPYPGPSPAARETCVVDACMHEYTINFYIPDWGACLAISYDSWKSLLAESLPNNLLDKSARQLTNQPVSDKV